MKVGVLQFFSWPDRKVPLSSVYAMALERIRIMDQTGYDGVWLAEHHFTGYSVCPSVHMMGLQAANITKRLRIGTGVSLAPFYNPLRLAEEVALLDMLSGGRVNWGAGRGFSRGEYTAFDIPDQQSTSRFRETVEIVLKAWTSERLNFNGEYFSYEDVEVLPKPLQQPHPPVWMAAGSDGAISWAASRGFSVLLGPHDSRAMLTQKRKLYGDGLAAAGHVDGDRDLPMARLIALGETRERATQVARRGAEWLVQSYAGPQHNSVLNHTKNYEGLDPIDFYMKEVIVHGTPDSVVDQIRALGESVPMNYLLAAPLSRETFTLLTDKVVPHVATPSRSLSAA